MARLSPARAAPQTTQLPDAGADTLVSRAARDPASFVEVYDAYADRVMVFLARRVYDAELAFELHQEVFAIVWEKRASFRGTTSAEEESWIFTIARNELAAFYRRGAVERSAADRLGLARVGLSDASLERVEELADLVARKPEIDAALGALPVDQRNAVELRVVQEKGYDEIAGQLGVTQDVARARVSRGLRALAGHVGRIEESA